MKPLSKAWQSFAPSSRGDAVEKLLEGKVVQTEGPPLPDRIEGKDVDIQKSVKALNDPTYAGMNQGEISLIERSSQQSGVSEPVKKLHHKDQEHRLRMKQVKKVKVRPRPGANAPGGGGVKKSKTVPTTTTTNMVEVPPQNTVKELPIETIDEHTQRNNTPSLFTTRLSSMNRVSTEVLVSHPPPAEVLAYAKNIEGLQPSYVGMQRFVSESNGMYNYPDVPVLSRKAILPFYRAPIPGRKEERPCLNLDRNPYAHEGKTRCMAHIMSAEKLGEDKAFRCRELLIGDVNARIEEAVRAGRDPSIHLSPAPGYCIFCHMLIVLQDSIKQQHRSKNRREVKRQEAAFLSSVSSSLSDEDNEEEEENIVIVNPFMVIANKPGEYNQSALLLYEKVRAGIWGPFLMLNTDNYIATTSIPDSLGVPGFQERSTMHFFRPTRVSSHPNESQPRTLFTQSAPTGVTFGTMSSQN